MNETKVGSKRLQITYAAEDPPVAPGRTLIVSVWPFTSRATRSLPSFREILIKRIELTLFFFLLLLLQSIDSAVSRTDLKDAFEEHGVVYRSERFFNRPSISATGADRFSFSIISIEPSASRCMSQKTDEKESSRS